MSLCSSRVAHSPSSAAWLAANTGAAKVGRRPGAPSSQALQAQPGVGRRPGAPSSQAPCWPPNPQPAAGVRPPREIRLPVDKEAAWLLPRFLGPRGANVSYVLESTGVNVRALVVGGRVKALWLRPPADPDEELVQRAIDMSLDILEHARAAEARGWT